MYAFSKGRTRVGGTVAIKDLRAGLGEDPAGVAVGMAGLSELPVIVDVGHLSF